MSPVDFIPKTEKNAEKLEPKTPLSMKDMIESVIHLLKVFFSHFRLIKSLN